MQEEPDFNDERLQMLLSQGRIQKPMLQCEKGHPISYVCLQSECKYSAFFCSSCHFDAHKRCQKQLFDSMYLMFMKNYQNQKSIFKQIYQMGIKVIDWIRKSQETLAKRSSYQLYDQKVQKIIHDIFINKQIKGYKGQDIRILKEKLFETFSNFELRQNKMMENIQFTQFKLKQIIEVYFQKIYVMNNFQKINSCHQLKLKSYISNKIEDVSFIMQSLESIRKVKSLQLLYRASQHKFNAGRFHARCDFHDHTFTLIRTEFGKTIAGYTPLKWKQIGYQVHDLPDPSRTSFLLQVDLKQKMILTNPYQAISCSRDYGPIFGRDIFISDKCHVNNNSSSNFPYSYNISEKPYKKDQQSYTAFIGAPHGNNFKVTEYEVYKVIFV